MNNSSKAVRIIQGGTGLSGFGVRAGGAAFSQTEVVAEACLFFFPEPSTCRHRQVPCLSLHKKKKKKKKKKKGCFRFHGFCVLSLLFFIVFALDSGDVVFWFLFSFFF